MFRTLYAFLIRQYCKRTFVFWRRLGIHVTRCHFYEPVPDTRTLDESIWENHSKLIGIDINEKTQLDYLSQFMSTYKKEYDQFPREKTAVPSDYYVRNGMFGSVDGEILYCMIRHSRPKRIIEVGAGYSTFLVTKALSNNKKDDNDYSCDFTAIEPFPNKTLRKGLPGLSRLEAKPVQELPLSEFERLDENDILLIDSSHVLKTGSDVKYLYLEVLPRLNKGVLVSFHDIFIPAEYPKKWLCKEHYFWNEQYLLQAFLTFNCHYRVLWAGSYMHINHLEKLKAAFPSYDQKTDWPGSFWISKTE